MFTPRRIQTVEEKKNRSIDCNSFFWQQGTQILELLQVRGKVPPSADYDCVLVLNVKKNRWITLGLGIGSRILVLGK